MQPTISFAFALGLALAAQEGGAAPSLPAYSAKPIRGMVVDAETGQPLEGVIVVAQWVLFVAGIGDGGHGPRLQVLETVTDANGTYQFPAWGPKPNPRFPFSSLVMRDPDLSFFKPGYRPFFADNMYESNEAVRSSDWDGKTIRLEKVADMDQQWVRALEVLQGSLDWTGQQAVVWRQVPRMTLAILEDRKRVPPTLRDRISDAAGLGGSGVSEEEVRKFVEGLR